MTGLSMKAGTVLLIRHPETDWNRQQRYQGRTSRPFTDRGSASIAAILDGLRGYDVERVVSSAALHAWALAERIARRAGAAPVVDEGWGEIDHGAWEGLRHNDVVRRFGDGARQRFDDPLHYDGHGGETLADAAHRVGGTWNRLVPRLAGTVAVVSHATPIRLVVCRCLGLAVSDLWRVRIDNGGVTRIDVAGGSAGIAFVNHVSHRAPA